MVRLVSFRLRFASFFTARTKPANRELFCFGPLKPNLERVVVVKREHSCALFRVEEKGKKKRRRRRSRRRRRKKKKKKKKK